MSGIALEKTVGAFRITLGIQGQIGEQTPDLSRRSSLPQRRSPKGSVSPLSSSSQGLPRHAADHIPLLIEALLPAVFVGQRRGDLGCDRILLVLRLSD